MKHGNADLYGGQGFDGTDKTVLAYRFEQAIDLLQQNGIDVTPLIDTTPPANWSPGQSFGLAAGVGNVSNRSPGGVN